MNQEGLLKLSYGMYVVSSVKDGRFNGQLATTAMQVTSQPQSVIVVINKETLTHDFILASKVFTVSVLSQKAPMLFLGKFGFKSGRDTDKFKDTNYRVGINKAPYLTDFTIAYVEAEVAGTCDVGTHTIFIGKVVNVDTLSPDEPMTYDYYHKVIKGRSPKRPRRISRLKSSVD